MTINLFCVRDLQELRVLQRVFREAKFCVEADDAEISSSPLVAELFDRVLEALIETQVGLEGEVARDRWRRWLTMNDTSRDEWHAALNRAMKNSSWRKMTNDEKTEYVSLLFRPFILEGALLDQFITKVNSMEGEGGT